MKYPEFAKKMWADEEKRLKKDIKRLSKALTPAQLKKTDTAVTKFLKKFNNVSKRLGLPISDENEIVIMREREDFIKFNILKLEPLMREVWTGRLIYAKNKKPYTRTDEEFRTWEKKFIDKKSNK